VAAAAAAAAAARPRCGPLASERHQSGASRRGHETSRSHRFEASCGSPQILGPPVLNRHVASILGLAQEIRPRVEMHLKAARSWVTIV
jgi:hypothetical protein